MGKLNIFFLLSSITFVYFIQNAIISVEGKELFIPPYSERSTVWPFQSVPIVSDGVRRMHQDEKKYQFSNKKVQINFLKLVSMTACALFTTKAGCFSAAWQNCKKFKECGITTKCGGIQLFVRTGIKAYEKTGMEIYTSFRDEQLFGGTTLEALKQLYPGLTCDECANDISCLTF